MTEPEPVHLKTVVGTVLRSILETVLDVASTRPEDADARATANVVMDLWVEQNPVVWNALGKKDQERLERFAFKIATTIVDIVPGDPET